MVLVAALLIAAAFALLVAMTRRIAAPILELGTSARRIVSEDDYARPLAVRTCDETGQLTAAFNGMTAGRRQRDFIRDPFGR